MHPTRNDLPLKARQAVVELLQASLADAIDLAGQAKVAHWNVKGPNFIALHKLFDDVHDAIEDGVDELAERLVQLGGTAEGTVGLVAKRTRLPGYSVKITSGMDHVKALSGALAAYAKTTRAGIDAAGKLGDQATADLYTEIVRAVDKLLWMVEAHAQGRA